MAAATLARAHAVTARTLSPDGHASPTSPTKPLLQGTPGSRSHGHCGGEPRSTSMSAQQLCAASRTLLLAANAAECMCEPGAVPEFTDSLISWLLRMPCQCALAVLLSRRDLALEEVFSPNHALWCSRSGSMAARLSQVSIDPSGVFHVQDSDPMSPLGSDAQEAFAEQVDPGQLWLQIRYLSATLGNRNVPHGSGMVNGNSKVLPGGSAHHQLWAVYLSQALRLALIAAEGRWQDPLHACCMHSQYGPQVLVEGFGVTEAWMAPEFIHALWHPGMVTAPAYPVLL